MLTDRERAVLERWSANGQVPANLALRSRLVLACADGLSNIEVAERFHVTRATVGRWRRRFVGGRLDGLVDRPRPGAPRALSAELEAEVLRRTLHEPPPAGGRWSARSMAQGLGVGPSTVARIWRLHGLRPHLLGTGSLGVESGVARRAADVAGLFVDPPDGALVLLLDPGPAGSTTAPPVADRRGAGERPPSPGVSLNRPREFLRALSALGEPGAGDGRPFPEASRLGLFLDGARRAAGNAEVAVVAAVGSASGRRELDRWVERQSEVPLRPVDPYRDWLALVEQWVAELTYRDLCQGAPRRTGLVEAAVTEWVRLGEPPPFTWLRPVTPRR